MEPLPLIDWQLHGEKSPGKSWKHATLFFPLPMIQFCTVAMVAHQSARCCSKHMTSCEEHFPAKFVFLLEEFGVIVVLAEQFPTRGLAIWFGHEMLTFCLNQKMNHVWK